MGPMEDAFAVVTHPQLLVAIGALLLLGVVLLLESLALVQAWRLAQTLQPAVDPELPQGPEAYDWLYE